MATIFYLRVSTDEQAESGLGLEGQEVALRKAFGEPDAMFTDEGKSGKDPNREGLLNALDALKSGDVLAVAKRDRLARDVYLSAWIEKEAKRRGAKIQSSAGEGTENDDPANVLMRQIIDAFAEYERAMIGARTKVALSVKKSKGEKTGGDVPFGFDLDADGIHLVPNKREQAVIEMVADLRAEGFSLRQIATELEQRGIKTKGGQNAWHAKTISRVLKRVA
jgi:DNA invertase Pin-like site-specific DNA recombinase